MSCRLSSTFIRCCGCILRICVLVGLLIDELGGHCTEEATLCELAWVERSLGWRRHKLSLALRRFQPEGLLERSICDDERIGHVLLRLLGLGLALTVALGVQMDLRISLDRGRWIQSAIAYLFAASLSASRLRDLIVVVLEAKEVRHVICGYLLLPSAAHRVLMHHGLALVQIATHVHALNVDGLGYAIRLIIKV